MLDRLPELALDLEVPVRGTQASDPLVRSFVVVILHPLPYPLGCVLEALELRSDKKLQIDRLPEPLDLAQRHRMVRLRLDVMDLVFLELQLKAAVPAPARILPPVVREHLFRRVVLGGRPAVYLDNVLARLGAEKLEPRDVAGVIIDVADQVRIVAAKTEREDVRLPQLVRR